MGYDSSANPPRTVRISSSNQLRLLVAYYQPKDTERFTGG